MMTIVWLLKHLLFSIGTRGEGRGSEGALMCWHEKNPWLFCFLTHGGLLTYKENTEQGGSFGVVEDEEGAEGFLEEAGASLSSDCRSSFTEYFLCAHAILSMLHRGLSHLISKMVLI